MVTKVFEVRDRATCLPVLAVQLGSEDSQESWLMWRAGFPKNEQKDYVLMARLIPGGGINAAFDPFEWGDRTYKQAHLHIRENFAALKHGQVIDVEHILGEVPVAKLSERQTVGA